ncbi:MAG: rubredoxin [Methanobacteriaceae archaeon]|jgi:rubredoxin|nr:rubredoxin [Methanobacteriaceae archaeon]
MAEYKCKICGYIYDTEKGEKRKNVEPGTAWEDVPEGFKCPSCGAPKKMFKEI